MMSKHDRNQRSPSSFPAGKVRHRAVKVNVGKHVFDDGTGLAVGCPNVVGLTSDDEVADGLILGSLSLGKHSYGDAVGARHSSGVRLQGTSKKG